MNRYYTSILTISEAILEANEERGTAILKDWMGRTGKKMTDLVKQPGGGVIINDEHKPLDIGRDPDKRKTPDISQQVGEPPPIPKGSRTPQVVIALVEEGIYRATDYGLMSGRTDLFGEAENPTKALKELIKAIDKADKLRKR
jgi:hypothetical protein